MKKSVLVSMTALMMAAIPAASVSAADLTFATGGESGTYYAFGTVLANIVGNNSDTKVTAISSGGSQANIDSLDLGDAQIGFAQSDVMSYAYEGSERFEDGLLVDTFSTVASLYMEQVQIVTCDPDIKSVADLEGKTVSVGASGSGVFYNAVDILGAYDLTIDDITPTYESFGDSAESLKDGKIDAAFVTAGAPTTAVTDLGSAKDVYLVSIDEEHMESLLADCPYYSENVISADTYGLDEDTTTVAVGAVVVASDDVSEDDVYNFVSSIYENLDAVKAAHAKGEELSLEFASSVTSVPYHPGAVKYFEEKGIEVPAK